MAGTIVANTINTDTGLFSTNNAYLGVAKAWINYNGFTQAITASFNVSSVTRNATGDYTVNFTTAMANANYVGVFGCSPQNGRYLMNYGGTFNNASTPVANTTTTFRVVCTDTAATFNDATNAYVAFFGA